jgi:DNA-binding GntR family transcriptional regulator
VQERKMAKFNQIPLRESDRIEVELRRLILTLELEPGLAISEASLMKQYNLGRTPLREAFQRLAEQSLLQIIPHHGVVVTPLNVFEFVEVMDAMSMVIGSAAVLACKHMTQTQLDKLDELVKEGTSASAAGDFVRVAELDYEFHRELADATGNRYLRDYLLHLHRIATRFNFAAWKRDRNSTPSLEEHRQLAALFRQRDVDQVKTAMREHIENARTRLMGSLSNSD